MAAPRGGWLVKSEPGDYSVEDLARDGQTLWTGIRNYQSRNFIRDGMKEGDPVLYYHTGGKDAAIVGVARVSGPPVPDPTQFDRKSPYHDAASTRDAPRWWSAPLAFVEDLPNPVGLQALKGEKRLKDMSLLKRGRLSVHPVSGKEMEIVRRMGGLP
jgi:predicted RNA-binding protein with PUA-like domain